MAGKKKDREISVGITVSKEKDFHAWYEQVCIKAEIADFAPVSGTMVIRPRGYAIWQNIMEYFDRHINEKHGVSNAYFPLFIPARFFEKEKEHAEGFSPEVAWVEQKDSKEERIALRPTSETIMYDSYSRWIRSYRDLPMKINQWCNIVRWETKDCKMFIRSREFLWQEGHCVYETARECQEDAVNYLMEYKDMMEKLLCLPVFCGEKTEMERFPGAERTYSVEALMPDGKSLQMGTSHNLGQNFAKTFGISFIGRDEKEHYPFQNSWGVSTRMIGAVIMTHSDDKGLVLPPGLCDDKAVIVPIYKDGTKKKVLEEAKNLLKSLKLKAFLDDRDNYSPGWKFNEWEMKGLPLRIEIGPKDIEKRQVVIVMRDTGVKRNVKISSLNREAGVELENMKKRLFAKARDFLECNITESSSWKDFTEKCRQGKIVFAGFCGNRVCEAEIKEKTCGVTTRNIPFDTSKKADKCIHCGKKAAFNVYFGRAY